MIINDTQVNVTGTLAFEEETLMQIDESAAALILNNLVKMYSNPYEAVLREYTSNAYDSHLRAGETRPVEVRLPDALNPNLVIRDWGIGLDRQGLKNYGQFGTSTKRDNNDEIGGFGLGSKSGLSISQSFTVTAVKDGFKNTMVIGRREDGHPQIGFLDAAPIPTTDSNGLTVSIPTNEVHKFTQAVQNGLFLGWPVGSIEIQGKRPQDSIHDTAKFMPLGDNLGWIANEGHRNNLATAYTGRGVIGPVEYDIDWNAIGDGKLNGKLREGYLASIVFNIPNGAVDLTPSRESMIYSKRTQAALNALVEGVVALGRKTYEAQVNQTATRREALRIWSRANQNGFGGDYTWQGKPIKFRDIDSTNDKALKWATITKADLDEVYVNKGYTYRSTRTLHSFAKFGDAGFTLDQVLRDKNLILVVNAGPMVTIRNRTIHALAAHAVPLARSLAKADSLSPEVYTFHYTTQTAKQIDPWILGAYERVVDGTDAEKIVNEYRQDAARAYRELAKASAVKTDNTTVRILVYQGDGRSYYREAKLADLDATKNYILLQSGSDKLTDIARETLLTQKGANRHRSLDSILGSVFRGGEYTVLLANKSWKVEAYAQALPNLVGVQTAIETYAKSKLDLLDAAEIAAAADRDRHQYRWTQRLSEKDIAAVKSKKTRTWLTSMNDTSKAGAHQFVASATAHAATYGYKVDAIKAKAASAVSHGERYPLMMELAYTSKSKAVVQYVNLIDSDLNRKNKSDEA